MNTVEKAITITDRLMAWDMLDSAASVLECSLERYPYHPELLRRLGRVRLAQGLPQEAIPFLKLALQHDATHSELSASSRGRVKSGDPLFVR